jgi:hypothetical protein
MFAASARATRGHGLAVILLAAATVRFSLDRKRRSSAIGMISSAIQRRTVRMESPGEVTGTEALHCGATSPIEIVAHGFFEW